MSALTFSDREMETRGAEEGDALTTLWMSRDRSGCLGTRCGQEQAMHCFDVPTSCSCVHPGTPKFSFCFRLGL